MVGKGSGPISAVVESVTETTCSVVCGNVDDFVVEAAAFVDVESVTLTTF